MPHVDLVPRKQSVGEISNTTSRRALRTPRRGRAPRIGSSCHGELHIANTSSKISKFYWKNDVNTIALSNLLSASKYAICFWTKIAKLISPIFNEWRHHYRFPTFCHLCFVTYVIFLRKISFRYTIECYFLRKIATQKFKCNSSGHGLGVNIYP